MSKSCPSTVDFHGSQTRSAMCLVRITPALKPVSATNRSWPAEWALKGPAEWAIKPSMFQGCGVGGVGTSIGERDSVGRVT